MRKSRLFVYLFLFINLISRANNYADSLQAKLKTATTDLSKIELNLKLSSYYQQREIHKALVFAKAALLLAKKVKNISWCAESYTEIGLAYSFKSITDTAALYLDSAYVIFKQMKSSRGLATTDLYIGENIYTTAAWDKALFHFQRSIENYQLINDKNGLSKGYGKVSQVLINMNRLEEALSYARKGLFFSLYSKNDVETGKMFNSLGLVFDYKGELDSALFYYNKSLDMTTKINSTYDAGVVLMNMAVIYLAQNKLKQSEESTLKALKLMEKLDEQGSVAACYVNLGEIYLNEGLYIKSIEYIDKGLGMLYNLKRFDFVMEGLRIKSQALKQNMQFEQSLSVYERYTQLKDSLFNVESSLRIIEMQEKFKSKEQEVEIKLHQAENARQKSINNLIIGVVIFVVLIALSLVFAYRSKRKANYLLHLQKLEIEKQKEKVDEAYKELHEKNKEILDSIYYARRIQRALLTSERYIERNLNKLTKK